MQKQPQRRSSSRALLPHRPHYGNAGGAKAVRGTAPAGPLYGTASVPYLEYLVDLLLEVHVQQLVRLVQHQVLELLQAEALRRQTDAGWWWW